MHIIRWSNDYDTYVYNDIQMFYIVFLKQSCTLHVLPHIMNVIYSVSVSVTNVRYSY